ncbi:hypothetical protein [Aneurinibacillus tyrosinisolvens]|uniref:hypothetical protein n=1 Tax=Aneurinibacillus tyrosinisolvens TaxID=1443435 RepID=UPI00069A305D|nr:hypothetical protein [Aneurinibacillus tyrosinisolvens]
MESAKLVDEMIHIEEEKQKLVIKGLTWEEIKEKLTKEYRGHSDKRALQCSCCESPLIMVLNKKTCHFKHESKEICAGDVNYKAYVGQRKNQEHPTKHLVGKMILRTYLEGQMKPYGVKVVDGYTYNRILKRIPDFVLLFPDGREWCIDYVTGLKESSTYLGLLEERLAQYKKQGFVPYFFIDHKWLTTSNENFLSLCTAEHRMLRETMFDRMWKSEFENLHQEEGGEYLSKYTGRNLYPYDVKSLLYLNIDERIAYITRTIPIIGNPKWGYIVESPFLLSMERMFTLNDERSDFLFASMNETKVMEQTRHKFKVFVKETKEQEEKKRQQQRADQQSIDVREREKTVPRSQIYPSYLEKRQDMRTPEKMNEDLKRRMLLLELGLNPDRHYTSVEIARIQREKTLKENKQHKSEKERQKMREEVMKRKIDGESYFTSSKEEWRSFVIANYNKIHRGEMTVEQLCDLMLKNEIGFNQSKKIMEYPVGELIKYIAKQLNHKLG